MRSSEPAFTLIELLAVIATMTVLLAIGGVALRSRATDGAALRDAQSVISGLIEVARTEATVHGCATRLIVNAEAANGADLNLYLRSLLVVREPEPATGRFVAVAAPITLSGNICVVPPSPLPSTHVALGVNWMADSNCNSVCAADPNFVPVTGSGVGVSGQFFGSAKNGKVFYIEFSDVGILNLPAGGATIALSSVRQNPGELPQFNNARAVRVVRVRASGAVSLVHDPEGS